MVDFDLVHDGNDWIASFEHGTAKGKSIEELDREVEKLLREKLGKSGQVEVRMIFDNSVIPEWIRQYSGHYFNRVVVVNL